MFEEAAVVYLKTGSPPLLVERSRRDHLVSVVWFDKAGCCYRVAFHPDALTDKAPC